MVANKDVLGTYLTQVISVGLTFLTTILISKGLGAEGMGNYTLYTNAVMLSSVWLGLSLPSAVVYFTASSIINPEKLFINLVYFSAASFLFTYTVMYILFYSNYLNFFLPNFIDNKKWIFLFVAHFFILLLNNLSIGVLRGKSKFKFVNLSTLFNALILFFLIIYNFYFFKKESISIAIYITIFSVLLQLVVNISVIFRNLNVVRGSYNLLHKKEWLMVFNYILLIYLANVIQYVSYKADIWILNFYHGPASTGIYSVSSTFAQVLWLLPTAISTILFTEVSQRNLEEVKNTIISYNRYIIFSGVIFGIGLYFLLKLVIPILYDGEYGQVSYIVFLLLIGIIPFSICILFGSIVAGLNNNILNFYSSGICLISVLIFDFLLIPYFSTIGAAIAKSIAYVLSSVFCLSQLNNRYKINVLLGLSPLLLIKDFRMIYNKIASFKYGK